LGAADWRPAFDLAFLAAENSLRSLLEEALQRPHLIEGNALVDSAAYRARITIVLGLGALFEVLSQLRGDRSPFSEAFKKFVDHHARELHLWGEAAIPYFINLAFYFERTGRPLDGEALLTAIVRDLARCNKPHDRHTQVKALADPYIQCEEALARSLGVKVDPPWERSDYDGQAYCLRALVLLLARRLRRQTLARLWSDISRTNFVEMYPSPPWGMLLWKFPRGTLRVSVPKQPQSWAELLDMARLVGTDEIPTRLRDQPGFLLSMLSVYPQRLRADTLKLADDRI